MDDSLNSGSENKMPLFVSIGAIAVALLAIAFAWKARKDIDTVSTKVAEVTTRVDTAEGDVTKLKNSAVQRADLDTVAASVTALDGKLNANCQQIIDTVNSHDTILKSLKGKAVATPGQTTKGDAKGDKGAKPVAGEGEYVIKSGDTFAKIAKANGLKISDIEAANPGVSSSKLKLGQKIKLPKK